jgi:hypothetical protein
MYYILAYTAVVILAINEVEEGSELLHCYSR